MTGGSVRASPPPDGDAHFASGLARWLAVHRRLTDTRVGDVRRPVSGYASETVFVEATWAEGDGECRASLVVRMAPRLATTFADYDLVPQWQAQMAAAGVGVPVADPVIETDTGWIGVPFIVMPRVDGHIVGSLPHRDPWLGGLTTADRGRVHDSILVVLASIHRADLDSAPDVPRRDNAAELEFWDEYLAWSNHGHPVPALTEALSWCRRNRPPHEPRSRLLWGDARLENMVLGDDLRPRAVLDWDMTSIGAPEHDLAWFTSLDLTMHHVFKERTDGFPDRDGTVARFEELTGRPVRDLEWYETLAMLRSTAVMTRINVRRRDVGQPMMLPIEDNPLLDLLSRRVT